MAAKDTTKKKAGMGEYFKGVKLEMKKVIWPTKKETTSDESNGTVDVETLRYITDKYEQHIDNIKGDIKKKCEEMGLNFEINFASFFKNKISF